jgi:hypothetical protein
MAMMPISRYKGVKDVIVVLSLRPASGRHRRHEATYAHAAAAPTAPPKIQPARMPPSSGRRSIWMGKIST